MEALSTGQLVGRSLAVGSLLAVAFLSGWSLRAAYAITCGRRWYQLRELRGGKP